jgi:DNA-binding CsgD family transcriptional regulator
MPMSARARAREDIVGLAHRGHDLPALARAAAQAIRRVVPFDGICVLTLDPATLLPTSEFTQDALPDAARARMAELEYSGQDLLSFSGLARRVVPAASLSEATEGDLDRSVRHRELKRPNGFGDELRAVLVGQTGVWGAITLLREEGRVAFSPDEVATVAALSEPLVEGLRRAMLLVADSDDRDAGVVLLAPDNGIEAADAAASAWLDELPASVLAAVATRARLAATGALDAPATARVRTGSGRWLLVRGTVVGDRAVVILEPARRPELAPLIAEAYGLTARERAVTALVARGLATHEIAGELHLSPWTVQDHLKAIFEKVDVSSRGALVARLFFTHHAPRLG